MSFYNKILCYMWNNNKNHDKIYGVIKGGAYLYTFHGKRNDPENMKDVACITINDILKNNTDINEQYQEATKIIYSKFEKGYDVLYLSDELIMINNNQFIGGNWRYNNIKKRNPLCSSNENKIESIVNNNFYKFEENIKKKLAKKILKR